MKILITTDLFTTKTNGVVTSVRNLREELEHKGHDVRILTLSDSIHSHKEGKEYYIRSMPIGIYPNVRMPLSYRHRLIRELIAWKPDVIHSQCEFFSFQYARRIAKLTAAPLVHTYHTLYEQYVGYLIPSKRIGLQVVRFISRNRLKKVDKVIAPTQKVEHALQNYGIRTDICIVPSGICLDQHFRRLSPERRSEIRNRFGISDDQLVLMNLGRLGTEKNLEELLQFYSKVHAQHCPIWFLIVGDGPARKDLEKLAEKLGISDRVIFTGMVSPEEVQDYYQLGDVFVSASTSETQGLTYIEAAANGLPLLCRQDPCLGDVLLPGENGFTYSSEDDFLRGIDEMIAHPEWRSAAGKRSKEIASRFDKRVFGNAVEQVYTSVM